MRRHVPGTRPAASIVAAAVVVLVSLGWLAAPPAWSHVTLVSSTPAEGETLEAVPPGVTLKFSGDLDAVSGATVTVMGPDGAPMHAGTAIVSADTLIQRLTDQGGAQGLYTLEYAATSGDGHEVSGQIGFYVGEGGPGAEPAPDAADADPPGSVERADDGSGAPFVLGGLLVAGLLAAAGAALWLRRKRQAPPPEGATVPPRARAKAKRAAGAARNRR